MPWTSSWPAAWRQPLLERRDSSARGQRAPTTVGKSVCAYVILRLQETNAACHAADSVARQFRPIRFFVMVAVLAFIICGVTAFYTHRAAHGRTTEERAGYAVGKKVAEEAPVGAKLPSDAELNMMAQRYFKQQESGNQQDWDLGFENGYADGFKKTPPGR